MSDFCQCLAHLSDDFICPQSIPLSFSDIKLYCKTGKFCEQETITLVHLCNLVQVVSI